MKKLCSIAFVAIVVMSVLVLTACGGSGGDKDYSDSKYVGTWVATSVEVVGESGDLEDEAIMKVNADGTGTLSGGGEESSFTWEPVDNGFKAKGDVNVTFEEDGDNLKARVIGVELVFKKQ